MPNKLEGEQSPYLLQHAHNPVDWYPWGDEPFIKAASDHKPVLVSIGYSACHWCHVMERESFEDDQVAAYMNEHFVCIKVDREEHPDVDHFYMDAVQAIGGNGGWPLNIFVTPERAPFYGGTYYPPRPAYNRPSWMQLLHRMAGIWEKQPSEVAHQAGQLILHLQQASQQSARNISGAFDMVMCREIAENLLKQGDKDMGGFGHAPKFPASMAIGFLLEHYYFTGHQPSLDHALRSLDAMMEGGIYDQIGGGFARYATDRDWLIPHFEKMLYDNALLIPAFCDAFLITGDVRYKRIVEDTIAFVNRELKSESGGFYCAIDADSEGEEGKFYTWNWEDFISVLEENDEVIMEYLGVRPEGNWEGANILHVAAKPEEIIKKYKITEQEFNERLTRVKGKLLEVRRGRIRPGTDDKCLLSWNALMNTCITKASVMHCGTDAGEKYLGDAIVHMNWMLEVYLQNSELYHAWKKGITKIPAKLDDYAYLVQALLQLAGATGEMKWILKATELTEHVFSAFSNGKGFFYYTSENQKDIPVRKTEIHDGSTPSGNAVMAYNLWVCGMMMDRNEWVIAAGEMVNNMSEMALRYGYSYGCWATLLQRRVAGLKTVICTGERANELCREIRSKLVPQAYLVAFEKEISEIPILKSKYFANKSFIFVCSEQGCESPVNGVEQALQLIKK